MREFGLLQGESDDPVKVGSELIEGRRLSFSNLNSLNPPVQLMEYGFQEATEDIPLIFEIKVEGSSGDAGRLDDVGDAGFVETLFGEYGFGCMHHLLSPFLF